MKSPTEIYGETNAGYFVLDLGLGIPTVGGSDFMPALYFILSVGATLKLRGLFCLNRVPILFLTLTRGDR